MKNRKRKMSQKAKNNFDIDKYRQEVITSLTVLKVHNRNVKETLIELRSLLREQNSRVRKNEKAIARIFGMGSVVMAVFTGLITWLFKK